MHRPLARIAALLAMLTLAAAPNSSAFACIVNRGQPIILASQELDPDVFVWDSRDRLARYVRGDYSVSTVLRHTALVRAYTRAIVVGCLGGALHPSFAGTTDLPLDAIAVRVSGLPARGRFLWVSSADVRDVDGSPLVPRPRRRP